MPDTVHSYLRSKRNLLQSFDCREDYYIKPMLDFNWGLSERDGVCFLSYWKDSKSKTEAIVPKKDLILRQSDFTMIVAIDCVKIAFIMKNSLEQG